MRASDELTDAAATPVGKVAKGHTGGAVGEEALVDVTLVGVIVRDESGDAVETLGFILAEVEDEGDQRRQDGAKVHVREVFVEAKKNLLDRVQPSFVQTVSARKEQTQ